MGACWAHALTTETEEVRARNRLYRSSDHYFHGNQLGSKKADLVQLPCFYDVASGDGAVPVLSAGADNLHLSRYLCFFSFR